MVNRKFLDESDAGKLLDAERLLSLRDKEWHQAALDGERASLALAEAEHEWQVLEKEWRVHDTAYALKSGLPYPLQRIPYRYIRKPVSLYTKLQDGFRTKFSVNTTVIVNNDKWPRELPLVSVIIPCFNYGKYIEDAIDSVLKQTFPNFEIIVVDGCSTDEITLKKLNSLNKPKTTVHFRNKRYLVGDNRNFGIGMAQGKYICCLDADDILLPTYLEKALFVAESYGIDIVYPAVKAFDQQDYLWYVENSNLLQCARNNFMPSVALFRKEAWKAVHGFKDWGLQNDYVFEDWEFWTRLIGNGFRARGIPEPLMLYRVHGQGLSAQSTKSISEQSTIIISENRKLFTRANIKKLRKLDRISYKVRNPYSNLSADHVQHPVVLFSLPFVTFGGQDLELVHIAKKLKEHGYTIVVITTEHGEDVDNNATGYGNITDEVYHLHKFLKHKNEFKDFIFYLIETRKIDLVYQVGCDLIYYLLPQIKIVFPFIKIVDQLYNLVGHVDNNLKYSTYIDVTIVENEEVQKHLVNNFHKDSDKVILIKNDVELLSSDNLLLRQMKQNARSYAEDYLDIEISKNNYLKIFDSLLPRQTA